MIRANATNLPLPDGVAHLALWSPPYFAMREYGEDPSEIGKPGHVKSYVDEIVAAALESIRCLAEGGSLFVNVADRYVNRARVRRSAHQPSLNAGANREEWKESWAEAARRGGVITPQIAGVREKSLALVPERIVLGLSDAGLYVKAHIVWAKTHGIPDPAALDRTAIRHESIIHVSREPEVRAFFPPGSVGSVLTCAPSSGRNGHPAPWPKDVCRWIIGNWSAPGDVVLDAFAGSGTTGEVAREMGRRSIECDLYAGSW